MKRVRFIVEGMLKSRGVIFCRRLEQGNFGITEASLLAGRPVKGLDVPRKVLPDGSLDPDFFAFFLAREEDVTSFVLGEEVLLESP